MTSILKNTLFALLCVVFCLPTQAQPKDATKAYTIQLGNFDNVQQKDFELIRAYAYVYQREGSVFMGMFYTPEAAEIVLGKVKAKGYQDAFIAEYDLKVSRTLYIVQTVTQTAGSPIDWTAFSRVNAGELYTFPNENQVRVVLGAYAEIGEARVKAEEAKALGFTDAFARGVKEVLLNPVTDFDRANGAPKKLSPKSKNPPIPTEESIKVRPKSDDKITTTTTVVRRNTAATLQQLLTDIGSYSGVIDGVFGAKSQSAYAAALTQNRRLLQYQQGAQTITGFEGWEDARLLLMISRDLNLSGNGAEIVPDLLYNLPTAPLSVEEVRSVQDWQSRIFAALDAQASKSKLAEQFIKAFEVAYFHTQLHLEEVFTTNGLAANETQAKAAWVLRTLIGEDLKGY